MKMRFITVGFRKNVILFLFVVFSTILMSSFTVYIFKSTPENWLKGTWQGIGVQIDSPAQIHSWSMVFYADPKKNAYTVQYPSIPCKGTWKLVKVSENKAEFIETVDEKDKCYDNGYVIVTYVDRQHISFSWFEDKGRRVMSYATLFKVDN